MVRSTWKTKIAVLTTAVLLPLASLVSVHADEAVVTCDYETTPTCTSKVNLEVNVTEVLTVTLDTDPWAVSDTANAFLRDKIKATAKTNNKSGVTLSMYAADTILKNTASYKAEDASSYINTLDKTYTRNEFETTQKPVAWGYSLDDTSTGSTTSNYSPVTTSANPVQLFTTVGTSDAANGTQDVYFGAYADGTKQSGTYAQTIYFVAVTGVISDDNPVVPVNPAEENPRDEIATYNASRGNTNGTTTYTNYSTTGSVSTTSTEIMADDQTDTYTKYVAPAGVTTSNGGGNLALVLATAAAVAGTSGFFFLIAAKRRKDDDEEEE